MTLPSTWKEIIELEYDYDKFFSKYHDKSGTNLWNHLIFTVSVEVHVALFLAAVASFLVSNKSAWNPRAQIYLPPWKAFLKATDVSTSHRSSFSLISHLNFILEIFVRCNFIFRILEPFVFCCQNSVQKSLDYSKFPLLLRQRVTGQITFNRCDQISNNEVNIVYGSS